MGEDFKLLDSYPQGTCGQPIEWERVGTGHSAGQSGFLQRHGGPVIITADNEVNLWLQPRLGRPSSGLNEVTQRYPELRLLPSRGLFVTSSYSRKASSSSSYFLLFGCSLPTTSQQRLKCPSLSANLGLEGATPDRTPYLDALISSSCVFFLP